MVAVVLMLLHTVGCTLYIASFGVGQYKKVESLVVRSSYSEDNYTTTCKYDFLPRATS